MTESRNQLAHGKPKVSILIVSFNQKEYIEEAMESAISQDYENLEVIVSDDGSTDGTAGIIAQWQSRHPDRLISILNPENAGVTRNCNRALHACSGEFVTLMGGDDVLLPGKVAAQVNWLQQEDSRVLCFHALEHVNADGSRRPGARQPVRRHGAGPEAFIRGCMILPGQSIMVRASAIPRHGFDEAIPIASDLLFIIETLSRGGTYGYLPKAYYKYRHLHDSVSTRYFDMLSDLDATFRIVAERYPRYERACHDSTVRHVMYFGGVRYLNSGNKLVARKHFMKAISKRPLFGKAWLRLFQTFY